MNYSTLIHSGIVNPAKPKLTNESSDPQDTVTMDVPLLIRMFELMREDVKTDQDLHDVVERVLAMKNKGVLTMDDYNAILGKQQDNNTQELESIKKLAGI